MVKPPTALFAPGMLRKVLGRVPTDAELPPPPEPVTIPLGDGPGQRHSG
jgi:hypothetical protein